MNEAIRKELEKEEISEFHKALLEHCKFLVSRSRSVMNQFYDVWDAADDTFRGVRQTDEEDARSAERKEPIKMVVPIAYAQAETFVSFAVDMLTQREHIFTLAPRSLEDFGAAKIAQQLLTRDLEHSGFLASELRQFLTNLVKFRLGIFRVLWEEKKRRVTSMEQQTVEEHGIKAVRQLAKEELKTEYQGNTISNVSPYMFFPDTRVPVSRFQEGEFVAEEDEVTFVQLKQWEQEGVVAGVKHINIMNGKDFELSKRRMKKANIVPSELSPHSGNKSVEHVSHVLTQIQVKIIPSAFQIDGKPLGPEDNAVIWNVWIINDSRIVKAEPLNYPHGRFTYAVGEFATDNHNYLGNSLMDNISQLQGAITWFINSRIHNVKKCIGNRFVVNPQAVEMEDLSQRRTVIRLKPSVADPDASKSVHPLSVQDVTQSHIGDAQFLYQLVQATTGISENMLGQTGSGRRSATENRQAFAAGANRVKLTLMSIFHSALRPMAEQMIANHRDSLTVETFVKLEGVESQPGEFLQFKGVTKEELVGNYDIEVLDATLPEEKHHQANALQEMLGMLLSNPQVAAVLGIDVSELFFEWAEKRGIKHPRRFQLNAINSQATTGQVANNPGQPGAAQPVGGGEAIQSPQFGISNQDLGGVNV